MLLNNKITRLTSNGELEINLQPVHPLCLYFKPWKNGLEVYVHDIDDQINVYRVDPGIPILTQATKKGAGFALRQFVTDIPECIRLVAEKFVYNQTLLLQWVARYPAARDLLENNPVLLWLLVDVAQQKMWRATYIKKILSIRQSNIVGKIIGVPSKLIVKYLRKLIVKNGDRRELGLIMWSLKQGQFLDCTRHLNQLPVYVVSVIFRTPELATNKLVHSIADSLPEDIDVVRAMSEASRIRQLWKDTMNLGDVLSIPETQRVLANCQSLHHLQQLHERWTQRLNKRDPDTTENIKFPMPPLPGSSSIIPIISSLELLKEGREMQHCVGSYTDKVLTGQCYIYRILEPQRATVELLITGDQLSIGEFRIYKDGHPTEQCRRVVTEWINLGSSPEISYERVSCLTTVNR